MYVSPLRTTQFGEGGKKKGPAQMAHIHTCTVILVVVVHTQLSGSLTFGSGILSMGLAGKVYDFPPDYDKMVSFSRSLLFPLSYIVV